MKVIFLRFYWNLPGANEFMGYITASNWQWITRRNLWWPQLVTVIWSTSCSLSKETPLRSCTKILGLQNSSKVSNKLIKKYIYINPTIPFQFSLFAGCVGDTLHQVCSETKLKLNGSCLLGIQHDDESLQWAVVSISASTDIDDLPWKCWRYGRLVYMWKIFWNLDWYFLCFLLNNFFYELGWSGSIVTACAILCSEFLHMEQTAKDISNVFLHAFLIIFSVKVKSWCLVFPNLYFIIDFRTYWPKFCTYHD